MTEISEVGDFFALGATPIEAATHFAMIQDQLGCMATIEDLYRNYTFSDLLRLVNSSDPNAPDNNRQ
jgi:hypothetical protein